jgi:hypothetical protein
VLCLFGCAKHRTTQFTEVLRNQELYVEFDFRPQGSNKKIQRRASVDSSKQPGAERKSRADERSGRSGRDLSIQPTMDADASSVAASLSEDFQAAAKTVTRAVKDQATDFASGVGQELSKTAESQKARGVETIQCFARAAVNAAQELEGQSPGVANSIREAARKVEDFSENLNGRSVDELLKSSSELARSQPLLFIGLSVAAGFAMARFLKSSAENSNPSSAQAGTLVGS